MLPTKKRSSPVDQNITAERGNWTFSGSVASSFVAHAEKSIPFYTQGHDLICQLSDTFISSGSTTYELGVSTGELLKKLADYHSHKSDIRLIGIDNQVDMIEKAKVHCQNTPHIELLTQDIMTAPLEKSMFIVSYYCIQFIPPKFRQAIFDKIYESLEWGGACVIFEKVRASDARFQDLTTQMYHDFKTAQGFSDTEILQKTRSLRGVLEPYSSKENLNYFKRAGFKDVMTIFKYISFEGFLAIK